MLAQLPNYTLSVLAMFLTAALVAGWFTAPALATAHSTQPSVSIAVADPAAAEGGLDQATFIITRSGDTSAPLDVEYRVVGTATAGTDYVPLPGSVSIPAGTASTIVTLTPIDDPSSEGAETVVILLHMHSTYRVVASTSASASIADDDTSAQIVRFCVNDPAATESGQHRGRFTIVRDGSLAEPVTVSYAVKGSATPGSDYIPLAGSIVIPASRASVSFDLIPIDDRAEEEGEIVILTISPSASYDIGAPASATVTIDDNDATAPPSQVLQPGQRLYLPLVFRST
jgi:hypothetical protein